MANNGGDVLARGARRAQFPAAGGKVSQSKWDSIFEDYTPESDKVKDEEVSQLRKPRKT